MITAAAAAAAAAAQHLPDDLLRDILLRLPPRSATRCLAVCKGWRSLVSDPSFRRAHAERPAGVAEADHTFCLRQDGDWTFHRWCRGDVRKVPPLDLTLIPSPYAPAATMVLGSWDGVLCVERGAPPLRRLRWRLFGWPDDGSGRRGYVLWHPFAMACATVSPPPGRGVIIGAYAHPATMRFHLLHAAGEAACLVDPGLYVATAFRLRRVGDGAWREVPLPQLEDADARLKMHGARSIRLHGNLHWLVQRGSGSAGKLGKLCAVAVARATSTMEMWVLDDYHHCSDDARISGWRLMERVSLVMWDGDGRRDLSRTFTSETQVEAVHGEVEGEEVIVRNGGEVDAYSLRRGAWLRVRGISSSGGPVLDVALLAHRDSVVHHDVSFGEASRPLRYPDDIHGQRLFV
uniref:F-box domain-containing protein n=1 Tax=Oryza meridionalis TaxID=40149 RepID=A0A0E0D1A1_9ORYZ